MTDSSSSAVGYWQALQAGIRDSVNPGALTALLLFIIFLFFVAHARTNFFLGGLRYFFGFVLAMGVIVLGYADFFLATRGYDLFLDGGYFCIAVVSLTIGVVLLRDWRTVRRTKNAAAALIRFPFLATGDGERGRAAGRLYRITVAVLSVLAGVFSAFLASAWPSDKAVYFIFFQSAFSKKIGPLLLQTLVYELAFCLLLLISFAVAIYAGAHENLRTKLAGALTKIQVISAAVLMGYGLVMLMYFVK